MTDFLYHLYGREIATKMYLSLCEQKEVHMLRKEDFAVIKSLNQHGVYFDNVTLGQIVVKPSE